MSEAGPESPRDQQIKRSRRYQSLAEPIAGPAGHRLRVLLAQDNASNRDVALWQPHKLGCHVDTAANGREVLEASVRTPHDVVLKPERERMRHDLAMQRTVPPAR